MGSEAEPADPWPQPDAVALATGHEKDAGGAGVDQAARTVAMKSQCASTRTSVAPASQAASPWLMTPAIADPPPPTSTNPGPPESKAQGCAGSRVIRKVDAPTSEMAEVPVRLNPLVGRTGARPSKAGHVHCSPGQKCWVAQCARRRHVRFRRETHDGEIMVG